MSFFRPNRMYGPIMIKKIPPPATVAASGNDSPMRLNKAIAHSGMASRRAADALILEGRVTVNGSVVTEPGTQVNLLSDSVTVDGKPLAAETGQDHTYLLINKPTHHVSTANDPQGRKTVLDLVPPALAEKRLYPVGRLDYFSEGLLLLTDDGELTLRLTHPRYHLPKVYQVRVRECPTEAMLAAMRKGMTLAEGERLAPVQVTLQPGNVLEMTLSQGINRQIRRMCRDLGLTILRLVRVRSGPIVLGDLPSGTARELTGQEVTALKKAVKLQA